MNTRRRILTKLLDLYQHAGAKQFTLAEWLDEKPTDNEFINAINDLLGKNIILGVDAGGEHKGHLAVAINPTYIDQINNEISSHDVFLSYSTKDKEITELLAEKLRNMGVSVFLSHQTITIGPWEEQVAQAARFCQIAVIVISDNSLNSDWVRYEIGMLWGLNKLVAPALVDVKPEMLPELLKKYQGRQLGTEDQLNIFCNEIIKLLK